MRNRFALVTLVVFASIAVLTAAPELPARASFAEPSLSPDGTEIAFVSGGDIWTVPARGGVARLLVSHPATESRPLYSPDGKFLAFVSTRTGNGDVYVLELASGDVRRLTFDDASEQLDAWSRDSRWIYFSSSSHDIASMNDIFRVNVAGGTPMEVTADRYDSEFMAAPSPDGSALAFVAHGFGASQWWRHGRSHLDESELWLRREPSGTYQRLAPAEAKQLWPMWSPDGRTLYFMSDRSGQENIWKMAIGGQATQVTRFTGGRVLWPALAANGKTMVFERNFGIWKLDLASGTAAEVTIELRGAPAGVEPEHRRLTSDFEDLAVSPDGRKLAFVAHGEIFAASAKDGGDAIRVTDTLAREAQIAWAPDNRRIVYVSDRGGHQHIYTYDFGAEQESAVTSGMSDEGAPKYSPDGRLIAFRRGLDQLVVYAVATKTEKVVAAGRFNQPESEGGTFAWSPDSRWLAFLEYGPRGFRNVKLVPAAGGEARTVSFIANTFSNGVSFGTDGKYVLFNTAQRTEEGQVARVELVPRTPKFREDQFRELFKEERQPSVTPQQKPEDKKETPENGGVPAQPSAEEGRRPARREPPPKTEVVVEGIRERLTLVPVGLDVASHVISPDGKWLGLIARSGGRTNVYAYSIDELAKEPPVAKQLTATAGRKSDLQFSPDSKELFYLEGGQIGHVTLDRPAPQRLAVTAEMDVDFNREKNEAFDEAWRALRDNYWDASMNRLDWQRVHDEWAPRIQAVRTGDEMRRLLNLMIGELNSSHMGASGPTGERRSSTGHLGLRFDRLAYEEGGKFRITEVIGLGPADIAGIKPGETLTSIDGVQLGNGTNLNELLDYKIDRKISVGVQSTQGEARTVTLKPVRGTTEKGLLYRDWVKRNREYVSRISGGKLGYVHMLDMSANSLNQLILDLDSENVSRQGVVVDVRNNNGGFVNAYALDVLARRGYMTMQPRVFHQPVPARVLLGQRSLELPTILVTNQHSLSDAEDFTEGYRSLGLGKVVGEPTAGWIVYTGSYELIDGSSIRMPGTRIRGHDGKDMEMNPRAVDVPVERPVGESYKAVDSQLDVAVRELLKQIEGKSGPEMKAAGR